MLEKCVHLLCVFLGRGIVGGNIAGESSLVARCKTVATSNFGLVVANFASRGRLGVGSLFLWEALFPATIEAS